MAWEFTFNCRKAKIDDTNFLITIQFFLDIFFVHFSSFSLLDKFLKNRQFYNIKARTTTLDNSFEISPHTSQVVGSPSQVNPLKQKDGLVQFRRRGDRSKDRGLQWKHQQQHHSARSKRHPLSDDDQREDVNRGVHAGGSRGDQAWNLLVHNLPKNAEEEISRRQRLRNFEPSIPTWSKCEMFFIFGIVK